MYHRVGKGLLSNYLEEQSSYAMKKKGKTAVISAVNLRCARKLELAMILVMERLYVLLCNLSFLAFIFFPSDVFLFLIRVMTQVPW